MGYVRTQHHVHAASYLMHVLVGDLHEGTVKLCVKSFFIVRIEAKLFHVPNHAYDLQRPVDSFYVDVLANRILMGKKLVSEAFIYDCDQRRVFVVLRGQEAATRERDGHGLEV